VPGRRLTIEELRQWLPLLAPLILLELVLKMVALWDLTHRERVRGRKLIWALIILFVSLVGTMLYLVLGRED